MAGGNKNLKKQIISLSALVLLIFITFRTLRANFKELNFEDLKETFFKLDKTYLSLAVFFLALLIFVEACNIRFIIKQIGRKCTLSQSVLYSASDLYFSAMTPSALGGQPAAIYYMSKNGIPVAEGSAVMLLNISMYVGSIMVLTLVALVSKFSFFWQQNLLFKSLFLVGICIQIVGMFLCLSAMFSKNTLAKLERFAVKIIYSFKFVRYKEEKAAAINKNLATYFASANLAKSKPYLMPVLLLGNIVQRVCMFGIGYFVYRAFFYNQASFFDFSMVQTMLFVAVNAIPLPGAVGVSEATFLALFKGIYKSHKTLAQGMLFTRGINYYLCFLVCCIITLANHAFIVKRDAIPLDDFEQE